MENIIGLEKSKVDPIISELNILLADYHIFYQNLRGFHWNIKGRNFFELHEKFEEFYDDASEKIDEIAERILTLGGIPMHTVSDYIDISTINQEKGITDGIKGIEITLKNFIQILSRSRKIIGLASDSNDEGTITLISDYIAQIEKTVWMLNAYLS